jgi:hypothetical protein
MANKSTAAFAIGFVLIGGACFALGVREGSRAGFHDTAIKIDSVQAMLVFNHLEDERHWEYLLTSGCFPQATKAIDVAKDKDEELLAGFTKKYPDKEIVKYIRDRSPALIAELTTFKSRYGNSWTEEACGH